MRCIRLSFVIALLALAPTFAFAYILGPGDNVSIEVRTEQTLISLQTQVSVDGRVYVAPAGSFLAEGKTPAELEADIAQGLSKYYVGQVQATVLVMQPKELAVSVLGQVRQPGDYRIPDDRPLLSAAITKAGGLLPQASMRRVSLTRAGEEMGPIDLYAILNLGHSEKDVLLRPEDVIYVPARERWATVIGPVEQVGVFELVPGDRLSGIIRMAGGLTAAADPRRAVIERPQGGSRRIIEVNIEAALADPGSDADPLLEHGDTVRLATRVAEVYVVGEVAQPGPREFQDNRTLLDYIGLSGGVTNRAVQNRVGIIRPGNPQSKMITVDLGRLLSGQAAPPPPIEPGDIISVPGRRIATLQDWASIGQILTGIFAGIRLF